MKERKKYFQCSHLAGRKYHEADEVWNELHIGTLLRLERELDNRYDKDAVAVMYDSIENGETYILGYIPRNENSTLAIFLEMGWDELFECRISRISPDEHPENQIEMTIKIKRKNK